MGKEVRRRDKKGGKGEGLRGEQASIHVAVGKHKWKALRELKKARKEAGLYTEVREGTQKEPLPDLMAIAKHKSAQVNHKTT